MSADTIIPPINGCASTLMVISVPSQPVNVLIYGPVMNAITAPTAIVASGVTMISTGVFPEIRCPTSIAA